ncbi:MAG TPA: ATP-binding protein [Gammaproteobacteria bacterium]
MTEKPLLGDTVDREYTLAELLHGVDVKRLLCALQGLVGAPLRIVDLRGGVLLGEEGGGVSVRRVPLRGDLEPLGYLEADTDEARLSAATELLELLLRSNIRYRIASEMHSEVVDEDYAELQRKHEALKESEERYRSLSEHLEQRVQQQVKTIEQAQRQLYQSEKLASVGQLAAGVAHEINNPISFISSNLRTALSYLDRLKALGERLKQGMDSEEARRYWQDSELDFLLKDFAELLDESQGGAGRIARIVSDLKGFTRIDHVDAEMEDLNRIIEQVLNIARTRFDPDIQVDFTAGEIPAIRCYPGQLGQVFYNMLLNAAQSLTADGRIGIATAMQEGAIRVQIEDNGVGIPADLQERIFEPFFTTREVGQGTGLGLTVSNDIVRAHGGRIELESEPGKGARFTLYFPLEREG